jgi:hypothetical protein
LLDGWLRLQVWQFNHVTFMFQQTVLP